MPEAHDFTIQILGFDGPGAAQQTLRRGPADIRRTLDLLAFHKVSARIGFADIVPMDSGGGQGGASFCTHGFGDSFHSFTAAHCGNGDVAKVHQKLAVFGRHDVRVDKSGNPSRGQRVCKSLIGFIGTGRITPNVEESKFRRAERNGNFGHDILRRQHHRDPVNIRKDVAGRPFIRHTVLAAEDRLIADARRFQVAQCRARMLTFDQQQNDVIGLKLNVTRRGDAFELKGFNTTRAAQTQAGFLEGVQPRPARYADNLMARSQKRRGDDPANRTDAINDVAHN